MKRDEYEVTRARATLFFEAPVRSNVADAARKRVIIYLSRLLSSDERAYAEDGFFKNERLFFCVLTHLNPETPPEASRHASSGVDNHLEGSLKDACARAPCVSERVTSPRLDRRPAPPPAGRRAIFGSGAAQTTSGLRRLTRPSASVTPAAVETKELWRQPCVDASLVAGASSSVQEVNRFADCSSFLRVLQQKSDL